MVSPSFRLRAASVPAFSALQPSPVGWHLSWEPCNIAQALLQPKHFPRWGAEDMPVCHPTRDGGTRPSCGDTAMVHTLARGLVKTLVLTGPCDPSPGSFLSVPRLAGTRCRSLRRQLALGSCCYTAQAEEAFRSFYLCPKQLENARD